MLDRFSNAKAALVSFYTYLVSLAKTDWRQQRPDEWSDSRVGRAAQVGRVITVVVVGVVSIVGILIFSEIEQALGTPGNADLSNSSDNVTAGFGDAMELIPVVLIVLVAGLVISLVARLR